MAETKYGKYIVTELKTNIVDAPWTPVYRPEEFTRVLFLDSEVVEGAFYVEATWFWPCEGLTGAGDGTGPGEVKPHKHDFDEVLALFGTDPKNPHELCGEVEIWLGDEKHVVTKSCMIFIPKGLQHGPTGFTRVDRPVFHFAVGMGKMYGGEKK